MQCRQVIIRQMPRGMSAAKAAKNATGTAEAADDLGKKKIYK
jgi:hypothetical protein